MELMVAVRSVSTLLDHTTATARKAMKGVAALIV